MQEIIDAFAHFVLPELHQKRKELEPKFVAPDVYDKRLEMTVEDYISDMDEHGIDRQILSQQLVHIWMKLGHDQALPLTRHANNEIKEIANKYPNRFSAVATLPYLSGEYIDEFVRCIDELGLAGVQIFSNVAGEPLDSEKYKPFFEKAARKDVPIWIHPRNGDWENWKNINNYTMFAMIGWPCETSIAMIRLVLCGLFERHPDLNLICHHMGGLIPHFTSRIMAFYKWLEEDKHQRDSQILNDLKNFYPDTARQGSSKVLEDGLDFFGKEKMVFGTDYPFGQYLGKECYNLEINAVENMDISKAAKSNIYNENIKSIADI